MKNQVFLIPVLVLLVLCAGSPAWSEVQIIQSTGHIWDHAQGAPSPIPGYCYWEAPEGLADFHITNEDGYGNMDCPYGWEAGAGPESFYFAGGWPEIEAELLIGKNLTVDLLCAFTTSEPMVISAGLALDGDHLDISTHRLELLLPGGDEVQLVDHESGLMNSETLIEAGTYTLALYIYAGENCSGQGLAHAYQGVLRADFLDPSVPVDSLPWAGLKAIYR